MRHLLNSARPATKLALLILSGVVALGVGACGGGAVTAGQAAAPATSANGTSPAPGLPALPSPSAIGRAANVIEAGAVCQGHSFRDDLTHQHVTVDGEQAVFDPAFFPGGHPAYSDCAVAIYSLNMGPGLEDLDDTRDVVVDGTPDLVDGTVHVFAGLPSINQDSWEWTELKKKNPPPMQLESWSFGASNSSSIHKRADGPWLNVCIVIFGDTALHVSRVALEPVTGLELSSSVVFRKGWDGLIYGNPRPSSFSLIGTPASPGGGSPELHLSYYDPQAGQLYYSQLRDRLWYTQAVDCEGDAGAGNELYLNPDGGLELGYWKVEEGNDFAIGVTRQLPAVQDLVWSAPTIFDTGDDGTGGPPHSVGTAFSIWIEELSRKYHLFYEDGTNHRIMHAYLNPGVPAVWVTEYVTPDTEIAQCPKVVVFPDGAVGCAYITNAHSTPGTDYSIALAKPDAVGWSSELIVEDVVNPLDEPDVFGYYDVQTFDTDMFMVYTGRNGGGGGGGGGCGKVNVQDIHFTPTVRKRNAVANAAPGSFVFVDMTVLGDGSVRLAQYNPLTKTIYFENGDIPSEAQFTSLPAVQYGDDEDCDGLVFYLDPDDDADGLHDAALFELSSKDVPAVQKKSKELTGHVTLIK